MSGTIDVDPVSLDEHATAVRNFLSQIEAATADASHTFDINTFGIVCSVPAGILSNWITGAQQFINSAVTAGNEVADAVTQMANNYRENEAAQAGSFDKLQLGLEGGR